MSRTCPACRGDCDEDAKFCPHCGQPLPSVAASRQSMPSFLPPDDPFGSRQRVYDAGVLPEETERTLQRHAPVVSALDVSPAAKAPSGRPVVWTVIVVEVVILAVIIAFLVWRGWGRATPDGSQPRVPPVPTMYCDPANGGDQLDYILSQFGHDAIPTLTLVYGALGPGTVLCRGYDNDGTVAVLSVRYPAQADQAAGAVGAVLVYAQTLRDRYGLLPGSLTWDWDAVSGELWRPSVDTGAVIHIEYQADKSGSTETITKDWTGSSLGGLNADTVSGTTAFLSVRVHLGLTPAPGWAQITTWKQPAGDITTHDAICFAKIVEGDLSGALIIQAATTDELNGSSLAEMSEDWFNYRLIPDEVGPLGPGKPMTIGGKAALSYTLDWNDAQFRYLFVQAGQTLFIIESVIRTTAVPSLTDDIDAIIDSIHIS